MVRIKSNFFRRFHLDPRHQLLSGRNMQIIFRYFKTLDCHRKDALNDLQFWAFMKHTTDIKDSRIYSIFDMFDIDNSGYVDFHEFYLLSCMLIAIKDHNEREFLVTHSKTCFHLLDKNGGGTISFDEFQEFGFLFNIDSRTSKRILKLFDVDETKNVNLEEFQMFCLFCLDLQKESEEKKSSKKKKKDTISMMPMGDPAPTSPRTPQWTRRGSGADSPSSPLMESPPDFQFANSSRESTPQAKHRSPPGLASLRQMHEQRVEGPIRNGPPSPSTHAWQKSTH